MRPRRKLIVVANRGPVSFARNAAGERIRRRGGGGLVTALRGLVAQHDVTWIASAITDEDEPVAAEHGGAGSTRPGTTARPTGSARRARPGGVRPLLQRRREPDALVPAALHVGPRVRARPRPRAARRMVRRLRAGERGLRRGGRAELERQPDAAVFFHDYHLYLAPRLVRERRPDALTAHFIHIPWPETDYWHVLPSDLRVGDPRGPARERHRRLAHRPLAAQLPALLRGHARRGGRPRSVDRRPRRPPHARHEPSDRRRRGRVRRAARERGGARAGAGDRRAAAGAPRRPRRPHGPVEERRARVPRVRLFLELHPELHGRVPPARAARPFAPGHPRVRRVPRRDPARGARRSTSGSAPTAWLPVDLQHGDNFAQSVAAYKQYDALLVNAGLRRPQPRLEGGSARERARRRARSSPRTPARTRSSASGRSPSTRSTSTGRRRRSTRR